MSSSSAVEREQHLLARANAAIAQERIEHNRLSTQEDISRETLKTEAVAQSFFASSARRFANPGAEFAQLAYSVDNHHREKMLQKEEKTSDLIRRQKELIQLNKHFSSEGADSFVPTEEFWSQIDALEAKGISLPVNRDADSLSKEDILALKSAVSSHLDQLKTDTQISTMEMQTLLTELNTLHSSIMASLRSLDRLGSILTGNQRSR